jgi:hypothetical protein
MKLRVVLFTDLQLCHKFIIVKKGNDLVFLTGRLACHSDLLDEWTPTRGYSGRNSYEIIGGGTMFSLSDGTVQLRGMSQDFGSWLNIQEVLPIEDFLEMLSKQLNCKVSEINEI